MGAEILMQLPGRQHQQQPLAHGLRSPALRAVELTGLERSKLFLWHVPDQALAMRRRMSNNTLAGVWVESILCTTTLFP